MEQQDIQYKGMASQPSDYVCEDGTMKMAVNMEVRDGSLHAAHVPKEKWFHAEGFEPKFVHETSDGKHIAIGVVKEYKAKDDSADEERNEKVWTGKYTIGACEITDDRETVTKLDFENAPVADNADNFKCFCAIGNIIVFLTNSLYCLFYYKYAGYANLQKQFRGLDIYWGAKLANINEIYYEDDTVFRYSRERENILGELHPSYVPYEYQNNPYYCPLTFSESSLATDDAVFAALNKAIKRHAGNLEMLFPVLLKYAVRFYTGDLIFVSQPILIFPFQNNVRLEGAVSVEGKLSGSITYDTYQIWYTLPQKTLAALKALSDMGDLIKSIDVFISPQIYDIRTDHVVFNSFAIYASKGLRFIRNKKLENLNDQNRFYLIKSLYVKDLIKGLEASDFNDGENYKALLEINGEDELKFATLEEQEHLEDNSYTNSILEANGAFSLNSRIIVYSVIKRMPNPCDIGVLTPYVIAPNNKAVDEESIDEYFLDRKFLADEIYNTIDANRYTIELNTVNGEHLSVSSDESRIKYLPLYFEYDTYGSGNILFNSKGNDSLSLKSSNVSYTSYYQFANKKSQKDYISQSNKFYISDGNDIFIYKNLVKISEVNNPIVFKDGNSVECGRGAVISIASNSVPVSQGQFGQYPLFAFCTDGIYSIGMAANGTLQSCSLYSTDIITDAHSVGNAGRDIVFASNAGIMSISEEGRKLLLPADKSSNYGNDNEKQGNILSSIAQKYSLVLPDMASLYDYITKGARIAYDYQNRRIIVYNPLYDYSYAMDEDTQNWTVITKKFTGHLNPVAQCLMVGEDGETVYDYSSDNVETQQAAWLATRAIKLGAPDSLKTVRAVMQRGRFNDRGDIMQMLYGSRDLVHWYLVRSSLTSRMRDFGGTGYKYFRLFAFMPQMKLDESVSGCSVGFDLRMTGRMR